MSEHFVIDVTVLGDNADSVVTSIAACKFNETGIGHAIHYSLDIAPQIAARRNMSTSFLHKFAAGLLISRTPDNPFPQKIYSADTALLAIEQFAVDNPFGETSTYIWLSEPERTLALLKSLGDFAGTPKLFKTNTVRDIDTFIHNRFNPGGSVARNAEQHARRMAGMILQTLHTVDKAKRS